MLAGHRITATSLGFSIHHVSIVEHGKAVNTLVIAEKESVPHMAR